MDHHSLTPVIDRLPYALRVKFADVCGLRAALIPGNYTFLHGAVSYAESVPGEHGVNAFDAAVLRAWLAVTETWAKTRTYDTLTGSDKSAIQQAKKFFIGE